MNRKYVQPDEPIVEANDYTTCTYSQARVLFENGELSDWIMGHGGFPVTIAMRDYSSWDAIEDALSSDMWDC